MYELPFLLCRCESEAHCKAISNGAQHLKDAQHIKKDNDELPLAIVIGARHIKNARHIKDVGDR